MAEIVNLMELTPGTKIRLIGGLVAEVVDNPRDGMWVIVRCLDSSGDESLFGEEEMVFAQDISEILDA
tara:strand:+ start:150 stop:353 length:204 start_codon:yes stop_codon:yes gene_type:complete